MSIGNYVGGSAPGLSPLEDVDMAGFVDGLIQEDLSSVILVRASVAQAAQDMRVMGHGKPIEVIGPGGQAIKLSATVLGYKDHATITDTDIQYDDTFMFGEARHRVIDIVVNTGGFVMAHCTVIR